ncbi:hypothetical protein F5Y15DRAFT_379243 [Xylariaceae sp. FL0016]|nr:hypothetical protein F5Y15DRAFT_379243 [Xylariaceae sp. FL0016]
MLQKFPLKMKEHQVLTATPFQLRYRDPVQGKKSIDAVIHWVTGRGQLFVSFAGRNEEYPNIRAGAIVPVPKCRRAKKDFLASGGRVAAPREASSFEDYDLEDFEILVIGSAPQKKGSDRYPETQILGRFKGEDHSSVFLRSTFNSVYGADDTEEIFAKQRDCDGSPHPTKAIEMGWVLEEEEDIV